MSSSTDGAARGDGVTSKSHHNLAAMERFDVVVVGGCGHVGLPLALSFADCGYKVGLGDIGHAKIEQGRSGTLPLLANGAEALLRKILPTGRLVLAAAPSMLARSD